MLHKGEAVVPARYNHSHGGDVHNWSFAPTVHSREPVNVMQELYRNQAEFMSFINRLSRNGSIAMMRR